MRALVWTLSDTMPACLPVKDCALWPERLDGKGEQRDGHALARGEEHVHLPRVWVVAHLRGEIDQLVRLAAHGRDDDHHVVALFPGPDDALRHVLDPLGISDGCAAVFLDYQHPVPSVIQSITLLPQRTLSTQREAKGLEH